MNKNMVWLAIACGALAGCGGGGGGGDSSTPTVVDTDKDTVADTSDCAPTDATKWQQLSYQSADLDGDGHRVSASGQVCSGASLPATYSASTAPANDIDCDDASATTWQQLPYSAVDADHDTYFVAASGSVCSGAALSAGYANSAPAKVDVDCADNDAAAWRFTSTWADADGDGIGAGPATISCVGTGASAGHSLLGYDPNDDPGDPNAATTKEAGECIGAVRHDASQYRALRVSKGEFHVFQDPGAFSGPHAVRCRCRAGCTGELRF